MTDGLRALAGDTIRLALMRITRTPLSGAVTGAVSTAILQSSSATTVAAVGFVGAGLMSFSGALGIVFGANIGTTITGWLVVLLGFKLDLAAVLMPLILFGVVLRLLAKGRLSTIGFSIAGFGLIFVGISLMQDGMSGLQNIVTPDFFPEDTFTGRLKLFIIGLVITFVTQSSSAGVAMAVTALAAGAISFEQAAAMIIGMDVGTTFKTAIVAIGGSVDARRTGLSHIIYNIFTGIGALLILSPFVWFWEWSSPGFIDNNAEIALVAFHSFFNILGVIVVLPFTKQFANLIEKIVPGKESVYTRGLEKSLLKDNGMAITALEMSVQREAVALLSTLNSLLGSTEKGHLTNLEEMQQALDKTHSFADHIHIKDEKEKHRLKLLSLIHALDHMQRLHERIDEDADRAETARFLNLLDEPRKKLCRLLTELINEDSLEVDVDKLQRFESLLIYMNEKTESLRSHTMSKIAVSELSVAEANRHLEAIRWLRRVSIHVHKILHHLSNGQENLVVVKRGETGSAPIN